VRPGVDDAAGDTLLDLFVRLAGIASPTGSEREIADVVVGYLRDQVAAPAPGDDGAVVLAHLETQAAQVRRDDVGDLALGAGGRGDTGQPDEQVEQGVAGRVS